MVETGIIRRFDDLGRIAVPKEVRKQVFGKTDLASVPMEFFYEKDGTIIMKPVKEMDMNWLFNGGGYMEVKDYLPKKIRDKVENIIVEADFDYDKNRSVQHYFVYLTSGERFDATTIKELKEKARQMN